MGLIETFMPEEKVEVILSEIEGLIAKKAIAETKYRVILGLCKNHVDPEIIYKAFIEEMRNTEDLIKEMLKEVEE